MPIVAEAWAAVPSLFVSPTHPGMGACALRLTIGGPVSVLSGMSSERLAPLVRLSQVFNFTLAFDEVLERAMNEVIVLMR